MAMTIEDLQAALRGSRCNLFFRALPGGQVYEVFFMGMRADLDKLLTQEFQRAFHILRPYFTVDVSRNDSRWCPDPDEHRPTWKYAASGTDAGFVCEQCAQLRNAWLDDVNTMLAKGEQPRSLDFGQA